MAILTWQRPFFGTDYTFDHLKLAPALQRNISKYYYPAGHMMYTQKESLVKMKNDLKDWISRLL